jgi:capsid assembly protein
MKSGLEVSPAATADPGKPAENAVVQPRVDTGGRTQVRVIVTPSPSVDPADPKPTPAPVEDKPAAAEVAPQRPTWLPEKFANADALKAATVELAKKQGAPAYVIRGLEVSESGQEVSDAYKEFEKKIDPNAGKPAEPKAEEKPEVKAEEKPAETPTPFVKSEEVKKYERETFGTYVAEMLDKAETSAEAMGQEFAANGNKLSDATYAKFEKAGVARPFLDAYIAGMVGNARTLAETHVKEVKTEVFGGDEGFNKVAVWASANLTKEQHEIYTTMTNSGSLVAAKEAARMLKGWHEKANGTPPKVRVVPDVPVETEPKGYESREQMIKDMNDPRYKINDKAFHKMVEQKLLHTKL